MGVNVDDVRISWTEPRREMIDPSKEVSAMKDAVRSGFVNISDAIRQLGKNPDDHFQDLKRDNDIIDSFKLVLDSDPRKTANSGSLQS